MRKYILFICFLYTTAFAIAQKDQVKLKLTLRDGSIVTGKVKIEKLDLKTNYGKLEIPLVDLQSIKIGVGRNTADESFVLTNLRKLADTNIVEQDKAYQSLINGKIGWISVIEDYLMANYSENIATNKIEDILNQLKSKFKIGIDYTEVDIFITNNDFIIGGFYDFENVDLSTDYGNLKIEKEKIQQIEILKTYNKQARIIKLMANKNISSNSNGGWINTGINLSIGDTIELTSTGQIVLASLNGSKYTPEGKPMSASEELLDYNGESTSNKFAPTYGSFVFKIGESGVTIKAGTKYKEIIKSSGNLYLSIYESVYNPQNTGCFIVKIH